MKVKCKWVGESGHNKDLGNVEKNKQLELDQSTFDYFLSLGLVKEVKEKEKKESETKTEE